MNEEKIFGEIEGILGQIDLKNKIAKKQKKLQGLEPELEQEDISKDPKQQLREFFDFLKMDQSIVNDNEIEALIDLAIYKKMEVDKKNLDNNNKKKEDYYEQPLKPEDLLRVFIVDEKQAEKEQRDLQNAFRILTSDFNDEEIELQDLEQKLMMYDKNNKDSIKDIMQELYDQSDFLSMEENKKHDNELPEIIQQQTPYGSYNKNNFKEFYKFNYKEYLQKQFKSSK